MKKIFYLAIISLIVFAGCSRNNVIQIEAQGSFAVGGVVLTDSLGRKYHGDHAYTFYQIPVSARKYPLVFAHGVGHSVKHGKQHPMVERVFRTSLFAEVLAHM